MRAARYGTSALFRFVFTGVGLLQRLKDRAVWSFITRATMNQRLERFCHLQHALDASVQFGDVLLGQALDVGTLARLVVPQAQQIRDLGHREAEIARAAMRKLRAKLLALLDQAYPLRTAHHLARKHPVRFVMLVVYAAGLLFIFLMRRQD